MSINFQTHKLELIEGNFNVLKDFANAIFHTVVFHRALKVTQPYETKCSFLEFYYMRCGDQTYEKQVDSKIDYMLENITKLKEDEITLTFYKKLGASQSLFGGATSNKELWENWIVPFRFIDVSDADVNTIEMEEKLQSLIMDVLNKVQESSSCMPDMYDGMKCFPFEIEIKRAGAGSNKAGAGFLGGLFKKFAN